MKTLLIIISWMGSAPMDRLEYEMPSLATCERMVVKLATDWHDANDNAKFSYIASCIQRAEEEIE